MGSAAGSLAESPHVLSDRTRSLRADMHPRMKVSLDGEPAECERLDVRLLESPLAVMTEPTEGEYVGDGTGQPMRPRQSMEYRRREIGCLFGVVE